MYTGVGEGRSRREGVTRVIDIYREGGGMLAKDLNYFHNKQHMLYR